MDLLDENKKSNDNIVKYYIQRLEYIQEYLNKHTFIVLDESKQDSYRDKDYDCNGNGNCFDNIPGTYDYIKIRSNCECQLVKCPNYTSCLHYIVPFEDKNYYGFCYPCGIENHLKDK